MDRLTREAITVCLLLMAFAAPMSIAITQAAWALGLFFWIIRSFFVRPRPKFEKLDIAVFAFVGLTLVSSVFSYEPGVSMGKMLSVSLFTIVYLVATNLKDKKTLHRMLILLLAGCFISCSWAFARQARGRYLKVTKLSAESPLRAAGVEENDTIRIANGRIISTPDGLRDALLEPQADGVARVGIYRHELVLTYPVAHSQITDTASLGILEHQRGRDMRARGFFGHYTTFAEALQLIGSVALALLLTLAGNYFSRNRILLAVVFVAAIVALFLTITRASWLSFVISATIITLLSTSRRTVLICIAIAVPLFIGGLIYLQQKRQVAFFDSSDDSTTWRMRRWKEASNVLVSNPRHLAVGIGMDSVKTNWWRWGMFDNGYQAQSHMHNNYLQFAFERGVPTLIAWLAWMAFYLLLLWRNIRFRRFSWPARGLLIGAFAGTIGFMTSGIVHYNWGDSEVVMIFYLIMGLSLAVVRNPELTRAE